MPKIDRLNMHNVHTIGSYKYIQYHVLLKNFPAFGYHTYFSYLL